MKPKNFIFVLNDANTAHTGLPVVHGLEKRGHHVCIVTGGVATKIVTEAGITPFQKSVAGSGFGAMDFLQIFEWTDPSCIITGVSNPTPFEEPVGVLANENGIPLVTIEDIWGASLRSIAHPDLIITPDDVSEVMSRRGHPSARVVIGGNIGARKVTPSPAVIALMDELRSRYEQVIVFTESGKPDDPSVDEQIGLLTQCMQCTSGKVAVIPRLHPKWEKVTRQGTTLHAWWTMLLTTGIPSVEIIKGQSTEELVAAADATVSGFSSLLTTAAYNGKVAISLSTPSTMGFMHESIMKISFPLVELGCAHQITIPCNLSEVLERKIRPENLAKLVPFNPEVACDAIESLVEERQ